MLDVRGLTSGYGPLTILHGVDLSVGAGEIVAIVGANGAGKTTLLRTISGLIRPRSGRITLDGVSVARRKPEDIARAGIAHVPEGQGVISELTIEDNLKLALLLRPGGERATALASIYEQFPILGQRRRKLSATLSGGERQILVIARAVLTGPRLLLLDEPSLGLAPKIVSQVMELVRKLRDDSGLTVLLVEQNARSALAIADHGIVLNLGKVVARADAASLAADEGLRRHYLGF
jgi:branched-chain amino acid transport system ATP-binding protein